MVIVFLTQDWKSDDIVIWDDGLQTKTLLVKKCDTENWI